jgi:hypothetical protein
MSLKQINAVFRNIHLGIILRTHVTVHPSNETTEHGSYILNYLQLETALVKHGVNLAPQLSITTEPPAMNTAPGTRSSIHL